MTGEDRSSEHMTDDQWLLVKEEFEQARDAPAEIRSHVLERLRDEKVRRELHGLLRAYDASREFLEAPAMESAPLVPRPASGQSLGRYLLVRQVGEGGMGVVYEAVRADGEFDQRVAVKLVKLWLTSEQETARFRAERQILARLDHPHIARLIDGGTTPDGLPFLVMEFVDGVRIDDYCNGYALDLSARLQLFRQVCDAVEYAHAQGIVHRDLKPANILVVSGGRPKLLDFGIAKVMDPAATLTATVTVSRPATPQYASPEQLRGEPTTPASDIYSLGVLLYELITGQSPYAGKTRSLHEISRAVYEEQPLAPSEVTGNRSWRASLDRIVASAMQKNPEARYGSVHEFAGDVDRYLRGAAIHAHRNVSRSRQRQRVRWSIALTLCLAAAVWFALKHSVGWRTKSQFEQLYAEGTDRQEHFDWTAARSLFRRAIDVEPGNPLGHYAYSAALHTLGYESLAQREANLANDLSSGLPLEKRLLIRGRYQEYTENPASAVATYHKLWALHPNQPDYGLRLAEAQATEGFPAEAIHTLESIRGISKGTAEDARIALQRARAFALVSNYQQELIDARRATQTADRIGARELKAEALQVEGDALREMNRFDEAAKVYAEAEALSRETGDLYQVASIENRLGGMYFNQGDYSQLEAHSNTALALFRQVDNKPAQATILNNLSLAMKSRGDLAGALEQLKQAAVISREAEDLHAQARELTNIGIILRHLGRESEARQAFEQALDCAERLGDRDQMARSHVTLETLERDGGRLNSALDHIRTALHLLADSKAAGLKALTLQHLGDDIHASGDSAGGRAALEQSLALARQANSKQLVADDQYMLADLAREQGALRQSEEWLKSAEAYYTAQRQKVNLWDAWIAEARLRIARAQAAGTEKKIAEAAAGFRTVKDDARECAAYAALMESYLAQSKPDEAARALTISRSLCFETPEYDSRMIYKVRSAQVKAVSGHVEQARRGLEAALRDLNAKGWGQLAREARSALREPRFLKTDH